MQVRAFIRVAELGSVSRATEVLFRAQSVVTRAIAELEARFAVPLFERHANGMRLTDYGECLLPRAQRVLAELDGVPSLLGTAQGEPLYLFQARRLQVFVKLCETRHMQTVARHFGLSQPAVSAALKVLEGGCGQPLFVRTSRGLQPTVASRDILFPIRRALNELRLLDSDLSAMQGTLRGVVHVGALPLGRSRILPDAILRFTAQHPQVRVVTNESPFDLLATELRVGDVDFVLGALRPHDYASDLVGEPLINEEMVVLARRGHPLLHTHLTLKGVHQARWVLPRAGSPARQLLDNCFAAAGLTAPWPVVESADRSGGYPWPTGAFGHAGGGVCAPVGLRDCQRRTATPAAGTARHCPRHRPHAAQWLPAVTGGSRADGLYPPGHHRAGVSPGGCLKVGSAGS